MKTLKANGTTFSTMTEKYIANGDLNDVKTPGFYQVNSKETAIQNKPSGYGFCAMIVFGKTDDIIGQIIVSQNGDMAYRFYRNETFTGWYKVSASLVGGVLNPCLILGSLFWRFCRAESEDKRTLEDSSGICRHFRRWGQENRNAVHEYGSLLFYSPGISQRRRQRGAQYRGVHDYLRFREQSTAIPEENNRRRVGNAQDLVLDMKGGAVYA